jgi:hypothetical protein
MPPCGSYKNLGPFSAQRLESSNLSLSSLPIEEYYVRFEVSTAVTIIIVTAVKTSNLTFIHFICMVTCTSVLLF